MKYINLILLAFIFSCQSQVVKNQELTQVVYSLDSTLAKGQVIPKINYRGDETKSYALYLPNNYNFKNKYPIIVFFDSHAGGAAPLNLYKNLAEKYQYILVGSNDSKNGLQSDSYSQIITQLFSDIKTRISIDSMRIYVGGFSGGARVAGMVPALIPNIQGIIACGAGINPQNQNFNSNFSFVGIVGYNDFNYLELKALTNYFKQTNVKNQLLTFDGKHEWCRPEVMNDAFLCFEVNAMKNKQIPVNNTMIEKYISGNSDKIEELQRTKKLINLIDLENLIINYFDGLTGVNKYKESVEKIAKSPEYQAFINEQNNYEQIEKNMQQNYSAAFQSQDVKWWTNEVKTLQKTIENSKSQAEKQSNSRLLNYLSMVAYSYTNQAINTQNLDVAMKYLKIYEMVDPKNPDVYYFIASYYVLKDQANNAILTLKKAKECGYDMNKLSKDPNFEKINQNKEFLELIK